MNDGKSWWSGPVTLAILLVCVTEVTAATGCKWRSQGDGARTQVGPVSGMPERYRPSSSSPRTSPEKMVGPLGQKAGGSGSSPGSGPVAPPANGSAKAGSWSTTGSSSGSSAGKSVFQGVQQGLSAEEYAQNLRAATARYTQGPLAADPRTLPERLLLKTLSHDAAGAAEVAKATEALLEKGALTVTNRKLQGGTTYPHVVEVVHASSGQHVEAVLKSELTVPGRFNEAPAPCLPEVAAYRLARLMGLGHVPPAVAREVQGKRQSVQIMVKEAVSIDDLPHYLEPSVNLKEIMRDQRVFAALLEDHDRNWGNMLVHTAFPSLTWWIDFSDLRPREVPQFRQFAPPTPVFVKALHGLTAQKVQQHLGPVLAPRQIENVARNVGAAQDAFSSP